MANNRMYLTCRGCGEGVMLGKTFSSGYYPNESLVEDLNIFYDTHAFCSKNKEVHHENQFTIKYEIAHDEGIEEYNNG